MSPLTKMLFEWEREIKEEKENAQKAGRAEGIARGIAEERKEIEEITGISKKELENIKLMLAKT